MSEWWSAEAIGAHWGMFPAPVIHRYVPVKRVPYFPKSFPFRDIPAAPRRVDISV